MQCQLLTGDALTILGTLPAESAQVCVTSPPYYGLRDYGLPTTSWPAVEFAPMPGLPLVSVPAMSCCLGLEPDPWAFVGHMVLIFRSSRDALKSDGTLWVNMGDSYAGSWGAEGRSTNHGNSAYNISQMARTSVANMPKRTARMHSKSGLKPKDMIGMPWRVAFALQADGWYLRSDCVWSKPNPMPSSVKDRPAVSHEYVFMFSKSRRYFYDADAVKEPAAQATYGRMAQDIEAQAGSDRANGGIRRTAPMKAVISTGVGFGHGFDADPKPRAKHPAGWASDDRRHDELHGRYAPPSASKRNQFARETKDSAGEHGQKPQHRSDREPVEYSGLLRNRRTVWTIPTAPFKGAHFATYPPALPEVCILAGSRPGDTVLDPFSGAATTGLVALQLGRRYVGIELNPEYQRIAEKRLQGLQLPLNLELAA